MASIASSISLPISGRLAFACKCDQRAAFGTQNTLSARYSSGSSASACSSAASFACWASKASEMYLRKISPRATCLYSLGSRLPRSLSAALNSSAVKARSPLPVATVSPKSTRGRVVVTASCVKNDGQRPSKADLTGGRLSSDEWVLPEVGGHPHSPPGQGLCEVLASSALPRWRLTPIRVDAPMRCLTTGISRRPFDEGFCGRHRNVDRGKRRLPTGTLC